MKSPSTNRTDINSLALPGLFEHFAAGGLMQRLIDLAADEDLGPVERVDLGAPRNRRGAIYAGDITSDVSIAPDMRAVAHIAARTAGVVAGVAALPMVLKSFTTDVRAKVRIADGERVRAGDVIAEISGPLDEILGVERTMLNLVGRLSGVATHTAAHVRALGRAKAKLYDTRKTTPGLRLFEKYAVRCGGGKCHRVGLFDAVLLKDNHLAGVRDDRLAAYVTKAAARARELAPGMLAFVECEVDSLEQLAALLTLPRGTLDIVLLDNMTPAMLKKACAMRDRANPKLELEASGGVNLKTIAAIGATGVDRISVGALTHSAVQLDVGLDIAQKTTRSTRR